jgi:hypothetical protein
MVFGTQVAESKPQAQQQTTGSDNRFRQWEGRSGICLKLLSETFVCR